MPKNILQDIVPPEKRSIRNIPVPNRVLKQDKPIVREKVSYSDSEMEDNGNGAYSFNPQNRDRKSAGVMKVFLWIGGLLVLFFVLLSLSSLMSGATIKVTPKQTRVLATNELFTAEKQGALGEISFETAKITKQGGEVVPATGEEMVERKASGQIVIYNNFDSSDQRLIRNTRFETPEGLIYRIDESVVVPGRTASNPGSVEVVVYADEPGEKYNIGLKDFTIPGFKDDAPRYKEIYARSKSEMSGGFIGMVKKVSETDLASAKDRIIEKLEAELKDEILVQIPENFVTFSDSFIIKSRSLPQTEARGDSVQVNEEVTLHAIFFRKDELGKSIASELSSQEFAEGDVGIVDWGSLVFAIQNKESINPEIDTTVSFTISGDIDLMLLFDEMSLKTSLLGKSKKSLHTVLSNFPSIEKAEAVIKPFWRRSFPDNEKKIKLELIIIPSQNS